MTNYTNVYLCCFGDYFVVSCFPGKNRNTVTDGSVIASGAQPPVSVTSFVWWAEYRTM